MAAGCLYALDHHVERLAEDHENARHLAEGLAEIDGIDLDPATVETNIVIFEVDDGPAWSSGSRTAWSCRRVGPKRVRAVTHLDVDSRRDRPGAGGLQL